MWVFQAMRPLSAAQEGETTHHGVLRSGAGQLALHQHELLHLEGEAGGYVQALKVGMDTQGNPPVAGATESSQGNVGNEWLGVELDTLGPKLLGDRSMQRLHPSCWVVQANPDHMESVRLSEEADPAQGQPERPDPAGGNGEGGVDPGQRCWWLVSQEHQCGVDGIRLHRLHVGPCLAYLRRGGPQLLLPSVRQLDGGEETQLRSVVHLLQPSLPPARGARPAPRAPSFVSLLVDPKAEEADGVSTQYCASLLLRERQILDPS